MSLVKNHTDYILLIKFRKQQSLASFVVCSSKNLEISARRVKNFWPGCVNTMLARLARTSASALPSKIVKSSCALSPESHTEVRTAEDWPFSSSNPKASLPSGPVDRNSGLLDKIKFSTADSSTKSNFPQGIPRQNQIFQKSTWVPCTLKKKSRELFYKINF